jgi:transposase
MHPSIVGLDLAKHVFQVHGVAAAGKVIPRKKLRRSELTAFLSEFPSCVVAINACGMPPLLGRALTALGHQVKLVPVAYVKRDRNDEVDASDLAGRSPDRRYGLCRSRLTISNPS